MSDMAKIDLPYVQSFTDRHGHVRHYYRRPGLRVSLPGLPGSSEFMEAYAAAGERAKAPAKPAEDRTKPQSVDHLSVVYYQSSDFLSLAPSTQRAYRGVIDRFRGEHGAKSAVHIQTKHLEAIFHAMADRPEAVRNLRKRLSQIFGLCVRLGWRSDNPVRETKAPRRKRDAGFTPWTEADIAQFRAHWKPGTRERLALELLLNTGQRRSDVARTGPQHRKGQHIAVVQQKTGHRLRIRIHPDLASELANRSLTDLAYLVTAQGAPFTVEGFGNMFRDACAAAGLKGLSPHGLRKAQGRRLAEAGCSEKQIAAILGHASLSEVARYTRDANQGQLADDAMDRLEQAEKRTAGVNPANP